MISAALTPASNSSRGPPTFLLLGIPGLESAQQWLSIPLGTMYLLAVLGNTLLLVVIKSEPCLREPMYLFLALLAATALVLSTSTLPQMLVIFWLGPRAIRFHACLAQMFFIHAFSSVESGTLVAMALDCYIAICLPLRHLAILTSSTIAKVALGILLRGLILICPFVLLLQRLPFCGHRVIQHAYCEHMAVVKLVCNDAVPSRAYGLVVALFVVGLDTVSIALSYGMILHAVYSLPSRQEQRKTLSTCGSHCAVMVLFYIPGLFSFLTHRFGQGVPPHIHILLATLYLVAPPVLNPIVYGVKTQQIRVKVAEVLCTQWARGRKGRPS